MPINNPFLNIRALKIQLILMCGLAVFQNYLSHADLSFSQERLWDLVGCLISQFLFACLALSLWPFIRSTWNNRLSQGQAIGTLGAAGLALVGLWIFVLRVIQELTQIHLDAMAQLLLWGLLDYMLWVVAGLLLLGSAEREKNNLAEMQLRENLKESQLRLIRSQLNPHFLFNSLNSAMTLTYLDTEKARSMIGELSEFLRQSLLGNQKPWTTISDELALNQRYLGIEKIRFGERIHLDFQIPEEVNPYTIPSLLLQPLYENAIKYGVQEVIGQVEIKTQMRLESDRIHIEISNTHDAHSKRNRPGAGLGLRSVRERLKLLFPEEAILMQVNVHEQNWIVQIEFPAQIHENPSH